MEIKDYLKYTKEHEWVLIEDNTATIGITDFAQNELGDIVYVEFPEVGQSFDMGEEAASLESVKAVSELYCPITGAVAEVNIDLEETPEILNDDPYGQGWIFKIQITPDALNEAELMSAEEYQAFIEE